MFEPPYNELFIEVLNDLIELSYIKNDNMRGRVYKKALDNLMTVKEPINSLNDVKKIKGIGKSTIEKFKELIDTGKINALEKEKNSPLYKLTKVYGIGPKKAKELVELHNITTIEQLKEKPELLNDKQNIGIKYYYDILERIPRSEIELYDNLFSSYFDKLFLETKTETTYEIVGSYRRKAETSGDIDVIIKNSKDDSSVLRKLVNMLIKDKIIIEVLSLGSKKSMLLCKLPYPEFNIARRVDFMFSTNKEYPYSILYFTGNAVFNTLMRQRALDLGYTLNEHGLSIMNKTGKGELLELSIETEKDIFEYLKMVYVEPENRKASSIKFTDEEVDSCDSSILLSEKDNDDKITLNVVCGMTGEPIDLPDDTLASIFGVINSMNTKPENKLLKYKEGSMTYLKGLELEELEEIYNEAKDNYYNGSEEVILEDAEFDLLESYICINYPKSKVLNNVGAEVKINKFKTKLPYFMGSMNKIKANTGELSKFLSKFLNTKPIIKLNFSEEPDDNMIINDEKFLLTTKLDGVSGLYMKKGGEEFLYTRGDGVNGQDISEFIPYFKKYSIIPEVEENITVRGEFIISKKNYEKYYNNESSNSRNFVSGLINSKTINENKLKHIDFVCYEVIEPVKEPYNQIELLEVLGFSVPNYLLYNKIELNDELVIEIYKKWKSDYCYEIDGVIITHNEVYERIEGNPTHAVAFKMPLESQIVEANVIEVLWEPSKYGYLKPRVCVEPVEVDGVVINYTTGFNGSYILENKIGPGSVIKLIRSGDVIPHIMSVLKHTTPQLPKGVLGEDYVWNDTKIDFVVAEHLLEQDDTVNRRKIQSFFVKIGVVGLGPGNVERIYGAGYNTIESIINMKVKDFMRVDGFQEKKSVALYNSIQSCIHTTSIEEILVGYGVFERGFGMKKIEAILEMYPNYLVELIDKDEINKEFEFNKIVKVPSFSKKTASRFVDNLNKCVELIKSMKLEYKLGKEKLEPETNNLETNKLEVKTDKLKGKKIVFTGARLKELEQRIKNNGGIITNTVSKNTYCLILAKKNKEWEMTSKEIKAEKLGVKIYLREEFIEKEL